MNDEELRDRVRTERKRRGLTQKQFAAAVGMSLRAYQDFEAGKRAPQAANLRAILAESGITLDGEHVESGEQVVWPRDVDVFLSMLGAYLVTLTDERRLGVIHDLTRQIFQTRRTVD